MGNQLPVTVTEESMDRTMQNMSNAAPAEAAAIDRDSLDVEAEADVSM